jgi:phosphomannomutase
MDPENQQDLKRELLGRKADVGLAFDGDADRVFLVDEHADGVSGSEVTALVATAMLERHPGAKIVYNLICSWAVPEVIREHGGEPIRTRVGHSFIKQVMAETGAVFGGEHSGHYYFRENYRADSGLIAAVVVLERLSRSPEPLSAVLTPFRRYHDSGEINSRVDDSKAKIKELAAAYRDGRPDRTDGLTVEFEDWWFNVRPSNTEPLLRLNVEARTEELLGEKTSELLELIREGGPT